MNRTSARVGWLYLLGTISAGCMGEIAGDDLDVGTLDTSVINGTVDNGDPAVVMLRASQGGYCTGTLVSPTVVVTAAHCVDGITARGRGRSACLASESGLYAAAGT